MLRQSWPVGARGDIHVLALAELKVHNDTLSRDYSGFETDLTTASAEANAVRAELGLPAVNTPNIKPARHRHHAAQQQRAPVIVQPAVPTVLAGLTARGIGTDGEEVYANGPTSTPFALNVESDYWNAPGMQFTSYSPVTGQDYSMSAVDSGGEVTVTNSLGCEIQFSDS